MTTLYKVFQSLAPRAISSGETLYQQHLRGTTKSDLFAPLAARVCAYGSLAISPYVKKNVVDSQVTQVAVPALLAIGMHFYGSRNGYNTDFTAEFLLLSLSSPANRLIKGLTTPTEERKTFKGVETVYDYGSRTPNQERVGAVLYAVKAIALTCILYKLESNRNSSLPLKSYLYYGAGVVVLTKLKERYADGIINDEIDRFMSKELAKEVNSIASRFLLGSLVAYGVSRYTGDTIVVNRKWEALSSVGQYFVKAYL